MWTGAHYLSSLSFNSLSVKLVNKTIYLRVFCKNLRGCVLRKKYLLLLLFLRTLAEALSPAILTLETSQLPTGYICATKPIMVNGEAREKLQIYWKPGL